MLKFIHKLNIKYIPFMNVLVLIPLLLVLTHRLFMLEYIISSILAIIYLVITNYLIARKSVSYCRHEGVTSAILTVLLTLILIIIIGIIRSTDGNCLPLSILTISNLMIFTINYWSFSK